MTDPNISAQPATTAARIRWPWLATVLFLAGVVFLFLGQINSFGSRGSSQAPMTLDLAFGIGLGVVGATCIIAGFVLVGVRSIVQQQLDLLQGQ